MILSSITISVCFVSGEYRSKRHEVSLNKLSLRSLCASKWSYIIGSWHVCLDLRREA